MFRVLNKRKLDIGVKFECLVQSMKKFLGAKEEIMIKPTIHEDRESSEC